MFLLRLSKTILFLFFLFVPSLVFSSIEDRVVEYHLSNGMTFLLVRRTGAPVFTGYIQVKVGGVDEKMGKTGIAHMLEHMAFKGTSTIGTRHYAEEKKVLDEIEKLGVQLALIQRENSDLETKEKRKTPLLIQLKDLQKQAEKFLIKNEFSRAVTRNGGSNFNATTSKDLTSYFVELPVHKLELWAYLESERLKDPVFREFYQERDVVMEERRMRVDNDPEGKLYESFLQIAFDKSPNQFPTIGFASDIATLTATDLEKFYKTYYVPQNMVGSIVGEIDIEKTKKLLDQYFGKIPAGETPPSVLPETTSFFKGEKRVTVPFEARPQILIGYHKPTLPDQDDYVFDMIGQILCEGRSSRLYRVLVEEKKLAQQVSCSSSVPGSRLNNLYTISAQPIGKINLTELEKGIDLELERFKAEPIQQEELERARHQLIAERLFHMNSNFGLAETLTYFQMVAKNWRYPFRHEEIVKNLQADDLQRVAKKYFVPSNRVVGNLITKTGGVKK